MIIPTMRYESYLTKTVFPNTTDMANNLILTSNKSKGPQIKWHLFEWGLNTVHIRISDI